MTRYTAAAEPLQTRIRPPGSGFHGGRDARLTASLIRRRAFPEREACEILSLGSAIERLTLRMNARCWAIRSAPIANCEMDPSKEPLVEQQSSIHGLRQQVAHLLARWSDCLNQGNQPCDQPAVEVKDCHLNRASGRCRQHAGNERNWASQKFAEQPATCATSSNLLST